MERLWLLIALLTGNVAVGTSTDVSRYAGVYEHVFETTTAGVTIQAPQVSHPLLHVLLVKLSLQNSG